MLVFHSLNLYLILATGTIFPVAVQGVLFPLHTAYAAIYFALLLQFYENKVALFRGTLILFPIVLVMTLGLAKAYDIQYALEKIEGGVLASLLAAIITAHCLRLYGLKKFLESYIIVTLLIMAATIAYRISLGYGIGSRDGRFFINGPITYGWIMGVAATVCIFLYHHTSNKRYLAYVAIFFTMIVVTGSKGPMLAFFSSSALFILYHIRSKAIIKIVLIITLGTVIASRIMTIESLGRFASLVRLISGQLAEQDSGSIGVRMMSWSEAISAFKLNPFWGVGLGNWEYYSSVKILYPHNFFFEISSEMGLLGLAAFALVICALLFTRSFFVVLYLSFFLVALSFSGDMSYHRYLLGIPLGLLIEKQSKFRRGFAI